MNASFVNRPESFVNASAIMFFYIDQKLVKCTQE